MINFKNKNILITGASGGIGNELVKKFVLLGGNVLGSGTKTEKLDLLRKKYANIKIKKIAIVILAAFTMLIKSLIEAYLHIPL